jgi:hypothetical protein
MSKACHEATRGKALDDDFGHKNRQSRLSAFISCVEFLLSIRKLRKPERRFDTRQSALPDSGVTGIRTDAKSNYTAIKPAYNSRSQAPRCTAIEA